MEKHFTVSAIIIHDSKVLLVKHKKLDVWIYPGGHLERDEDPIQGLKREIQEEVQQEVKILGTPTAALAGCRVKFLPTPFAILSEKIAPGTEKEHIHIDLVYLCKTSHPAVNPNFEETDGAHWFLLEEIRSLRVPDEFPALIEAGMKLAPNLSLLNDELYNDSSPVRLSVAVLIRKQDQVLLFEDSEGCFRLPIQEISPNHSPDEMTKYLIDSWTFGSAMLNDNRDESFFSNDATPLRLPVAIVCIPGDSCRECVFIYEAEYPNENLVPAPHLPSHNWLPSTELVITPSIVKTEKPDN